MKCLYCYTDVDIIKLENLNIRAGRIRSLIYANIKYKETLNFPKSWFLKL